MTMKYVQLNGAGTAVITEFGSPQAITADKPGYAEVDSGDARYIAWATLVAQYAPYPVPASAKG